MKHLLSIEDLERADIERICDRAASFAEVADREIKKVPALRGRTVLNLFYEASTRTRSSFELAAKRLSADVVNFAASGSSVEKGESLKDTVLTLSAHKPDAIVIRDAVGRRRRAGLGLDARGDHQRRRRQARAPDAGAARRPHAAPAARRASTASNIWIVGDVLHSRVARSNILAFQKMGAKVTLAGPPTLIPRGIEALGCDVRYTLDDLGEADVVYALRMQNERMDETWVPSLREYADEYQINGRRLAPEQVLMHPGPVNRGVELSGEVVDSPQAVITAQVEAGVVVRMAVLYEVLAHVPSTTGPPKESPPDGRPVDGARPHPPVDVLIREAHVLDPRAGIDGARRARPRRRDRRDRRGRARSRRRTSRDRRGAGRHLFPAFVDPHVHLRTPGQEHKEDLETGTRAAAAGGFCAVVAMPNTDPVVDSAPMLRSLRDAAARDARIPVGFTPAITRGLNGEELTEMAELRDEGAVGFTDDGSPIVSAGMMRKALQYQRLAGGVLALHEEDPSLSGRGAMHEGEVSALLGVAGIPSISESTMVARDALLADYEGGRIHMQHLSARESVEAVADAKERGVQVTCEASPHHLCLTDEAVRTLDTRMKMNPPLRTEDDRQALIEGLHSGVIDCIATDHAPHARDEKEVPFEQAPMGTTGLETAFAAIYTDLVLPRRADAGAAHARLTDGGELFGLPTPRIAPGEPANLTLVDLDREWVVGEDGYESRSANCCFDGRRCAARCC